MFFYFLHNPLRLQLIELSRNGTYVYSFVVQHVVFMHVKIKQLIHLFICFYDWLKFLGSNLQPFYMIGYFPSCKNLFIPNVFLKITG